MSDHSILDIVQNASQSTKEQLLESPYGRQLLVLAELSADVDDAILCLQTPATAELGDVLKLLSRPPPSELMDMQKAVSPKRISAPARRFPVSKK